METNKNTKTEFTKFPLTVNTHWAFVDGRWEKFHLVFNADGDPVNLTPMTKDDLKRVTQDFLLLLDTL